ncbi:MAG: HlyD family efflux transporter periplasmic adaptor subunit [Halopseudomonas yangmingensis]
MNTSLSNLPWRVPAIASVAFLFVLLIWLGLRDDNPGEGFASGNGRIEATEIDIATKLAGRVQSIHVDEGALVQPGQLLAEMDISSLRAQLNQAEAQMRQAANAIDTAKALVAQRHSEKASTEALVMQRKAEVDAADKRHARIAVLVKRNALSQQDLDDASAALQSARAALAAARAQVHATEAGIAAANSQVIGAESAWEASKAAVERINSEIADSRLSSDRQARVQFRTAQPGEVLGAGGRVLNLVDLSDVYMTFFLSEREAGRLAIGSEVRIILDAAPEYVIPASISFVSSVAQFTPKTVETRSERQKMMFRVKARIDPELLQKHLERVKTGLPGVAWVKLDNSSNWPSRLQVKLDE